MNEPLVKGGQGRCASDVVSHSLLGVACIGLALIVAVVWMAAQWAGWWAILTAAGLLMMLGAFLWCKVDRRRMAREMVVVRPGGNEIASHVGTVIVNGHEVALTDYSITFVDSRSLDVEA